MVNQLGKWIEEKDYNNYPIDKWCDMDYIANWIRNSGYIIKTDIENLIVLILLAYEDTEEVSENGHYAIEDSRPYPNNLMVNIEDINIFVADNGGLVEFDYYQ